MVFILYDKNEFSWYQLFLPPIFSFPPALPAVLVCVIKWMQEPVVTPVVLQRAAPVWCYFMEFVSLDFFLIKPLHEPRCLSEM